jgi:membrane-bound metal-dependent hydrolase YbcI (DUF457 family)
MYPGHFAAGLALKAAEPRASTLGLMLGVGLLDIIFGVLVPFGVEGGGFSHFVTPWSHSLLMALVWSSLFGAAYLGSGSRVAAVMFLAVFSHWVLDVLSHNPDMQLWPYSKIELGYGPAFGGLGGWFEASVSALGVLIYTVWARRPANADRRWVTIAVFVAVMYAAEFAVVQR